MLEKYKGKLDEMRWSLKPAWILNILSNNPHYEKVIFLDPDLYFFNSPEFLLNEFDKGSVLLCPHWRSANPYADSENFRLNFCDGIFNGGLVGASRSGIDAMSWWAEACYYKCENDTEKGFFVDQKYLDFLPSRFEDVQVVRHMGCNIANWNIADCDRKSEGGSIYINDSYPLIFIHFTKSTILGIIRGKDPVLKPCLDEYRHSLNRLGPIYKSGYAPIAEREKPIKFKDKIRRKAKSIYLHKTVKR